MATEQVAPTVNGNYASQHHQSHDSSGQYLASYSTGEGTGSGNGTGDSFEVQQTSQVTPGSSTSGVDVEPSQGRSWMVICQAILSFPSRLPRKASCQ